MLLGTVEVGDVFGALVVVDEDDETSYPIRAPTAAATTAAATAISIRT